MVDIEAFGHFFGFTATASFAATLYKEMQPILFTVITDFKVEDLYEEKKMCEENHRFFLDLCSDTEKEMSDGEHLKSQITKIELERTKLNVEEAALKVTFFLDDIKSDVYKDNFDKKVRPLFPLAGTYSVIVLLIGAFSSAYHSESNLYLNVLLFVNIITTIMVGINVKYFDRSKSVNARNLFLNQYLLFFTAISVILCLIITNNNYYLFSFQSWSERFVLIWSLLLSGIASIGLIWKFVRVNSAAKERIKAFRFVNNIYDSELKKLLGK